MRGSYRWATLLTAGLLMTLPLCHAQNTDVDIRLTVDPANQSQINGGVFEGWGTSLCWWANRVGYSDALAQ